MKSSATTEASSLTLDPKSVTEAFENVYDVLDEHRQAILDIKAVLLDMAAKYDEVSGAVLSLLNHLEGGALQ